VIPRVALVTGAASGIGRRLAELLVQRGTCVVAADVDEAGLRRVFDEEVFPPDRAAAVRLDVREPGDWEAAVGEATGRWGRLDLLLNVAGCLRTGKVHEMPARDLALQFDVNAKGVMLGTRAASELMVRQGAGHIVNVASMAALAPIPGLAGYSASKYAVRCFSLAAAEELWPHGVAVTVVCPDAVQTPMLDQQLDHESAALTFSGSKVLTVDDVAEAVLGRVLRERPLEVWLPPSRGLMARGGDMRPRVGFTIGRSLRKRGLARQRRMRAGQ
jgi:3-oxoacyl-[acyl-carrier protein] reductase